MAPQTKRRRTGTNISSPAASTRSTSASKSATQSTLSFRASKAVSSSGKDVKEKKEKKALVEPEVEIVQKADVAPPASEQSSLAPPQPEETEVAAELEEEDEEEIAIKEKALKLSDKKLREYWSHKEKERKAPRVHQKDVPLREKILREWDTTTRFGPSTGLTRSQRWWRAHGLDMQPPLEVLSVLLQGGQQEQSVIDELFTTRLDPDAHVDA